MYNRFRSKKAFTITELVVVIAVIAILAAILIPTFSEVIDNSKKAHDVQLVKEINTALSVYKAETGSNPKDYPELMKALSQQGLTDASNPFLLATALKQDNAYLIWYPNTNAVSLYVDSEDYVLVKTSAIGMGNGIFLQDTAGSEGSLGYLLCVNGQHNFIAQLYYDFYELSGGNINDFNVNFGGSYTNENILANAGDKTWANSIIAAIGNQKVGYTHSTVIETEITEQVATSSNAVVNIKEALGESSDKDYTALDTKEKEVVDQAVRSAMATMATIANDKEKAETLAGKTISLSVPEGTEVSFEDVTLTAIGINYRKDVEMENNTKSSTFSTNFGGLTIVDMSVEEGEFISSGAEYQTSKDTGLPMDGYMFTYGLFGSVFAKAGETVTIENLSIKNVNVDLNGATETIGGKELLTRTDQAGVVVGYAKGDVVLKNITVNGVSEENSETRGLIKGYDGVAGLVGRVDGRAGGELRIEDCEVRNLTVAGERRASGFVGVIYKDAQVEIVKSSLKNVELKIDRRDGGTESFIGAVGDMMSEPTSASLEDVKFEDVVFTFYATRVNEPAVNSPFEAYNGNCYSEVNGKNFIFGRMYAKVELSIKNVTIINGGVSNKISDTTVTEGMSATDTVSITTTTITTTNGEKEYYHHYKVSVAE